MFVFCLFEKLVKDAIFFGIYVRVFRFIKNKKRKINFPGHKLNSQCIEKN